MINSPTLISSGRRHITIMAFCISLGGFVFVYNTVCLTQLASLLQLKNNLTNEELVYQLSIATSALNFGSLISPILYKKYIETFGELNGLLLIDLVGIMTVIVELISLQFWFLATTRLILGFVLGISSAIIPIYINSLAPPSIMGRLGSLNQLLQTLGVLVAYLCGYFINERDKDDQIRWRFLLGFVPIVFLGLRIIILQFIYPFDTLQRHIKKNEMFKLNQYNKMVYGSQSQSIVSWIKQTKSFHKISYESSQTWRKRFILALIVISANQFSGVNAIMFYAKQLFGKITNGDAPNTQNIIVLLSLLQLLAVLINTQIIDKVGRKNLILKGQSALIILLFLIFFSNNILSQIAPPQVSTVCTILFIFLHIFIMNSTLSSSCLVYCTQILSDVSFIIVVFKGYSLLIALTTQYIIQYIGIGFMFLGFGILSLLAYIALRTNLVETKGLSTKQVYSLFDKNNKKVEKKLLEVGIENESLVSIDQERLRK